MNKSADDRMRLSRKMVDMLRHEGCDISSASEIALLTYWAMFRATGTPAEKVQDWARKQMGDYELGVERGNAKIN